MKLLNIFNLLFHYVLNILKPCIEVHHCSYTYNKMMLLYLLFDKNYDLIMIKNNRLS